MLNYSKNKVSANKYIWKTLKVFNFFDNPKFILILASISKVFRNII